MLHLWGALLMFLALWHFLIHFLYQLIELFVLPLSKKWRPFKNTFIFKMLFIIRMRPPTSVSYTLRQCSDMSRSNSMKWASPYIINGIFESHRAHCCERGRREVASVGTNDLRSHLKLLSQYKIGFKTCSSFIIFLLTDKYLSTVRFFSSQHSAFPSSPPFLLFSLITSVYIFICWFWVLF